MGKKSNRTNITIAAALELTNPEYPHILEFGVFKGRSLQIIRDLVTDKRQIFGFDSFEGLPEDWDGTERKQGFFSVNGQPPNIFNVDFFVGWFEDTIPKYLDIAKPISLLHIDCDLYSSTNTVLFSLNNFIVNGTIIVFDEWYYNHKNFPENRQHEQKSFYEWVTAKKREYEILPHLEKERRIVKIIK